MPCVWTCVSVLPHAVSVKSQGSISTRKLQLMKKMTKDRSCAVVDLSVKWFAENSAVSANYNSKDPLLIKLIFIFISKNVSVNSFKCK
jgi:hypothetical protein